MTIDRLLAHPWLQGEMPSHDEVCAILPATRSLLAWAVLVQVVAAMSGRSAGIVGRNTGFDITAFAATQVRICVLFCFVLFYIIDSIALD
jgi:hypothetical protein